MMELLPWLAKSALLLVLAGAAALALRKASADLRHLVWRAAFAALVLLPLMVRLAPSWTPAAVDLAPARTMITVFAGAAEPAPRRLPLEPAWIWAAGAAILLLREAMRHARARFAVRRSAPFDGHAGVRLSDHIAGPAVFGIFRPVVLLPAGARAWSEERLRVVLAHERMHILRGDAAWFAAARVIAALWWPNPLVWFALVRLVREAEQACDDGVLAGGTPADEYAMHLVAMVRTISAGRVNYQGGLPMMRVSELERRLRAMLNPTGNRRPASRASLAMIALATAFAVLPMAMLRLPAMAQESGIRGVVEDPSGARVPGGRVTVSSDALGIREIVVCDAVGEFVAAPLPEGAYTVEVAAPGFARVNLSAIPVKSGESTPVRVVLNIGAISERLTVRGEGTPRPSAGAQAQSGGPPGRIAVGGNVQATRLEKMVRPAYPPECKAAGIQGAVVLRAVIGKDGAIVNLERVNKLVDIRLADAALEAVKQWRYTPTLLNGQPVEVVTEIEVNFTLSAGGAAAQAAQGLVLHRVSEGVTAPRPILKVEPEYSAQARAAGLQGTVFLKAEVCEEGIPRNVRIVRSLGLGLDGKAAEALSKWRFAPGLKDGKPVPVEVAVETHFRLD